MKLKATFRVSDRETLASLLSSTKHLELCPTVATEGMNDTQVKEAFTLLDLIAMEFRTDPMSVQCFDLRIMARARALTKKWNEEGRP